ncbi:hypothetical protein JHL17_25590 [Azospirillum sp. YIM B02556]|uniref:Glycosyltransferase family 1 protein n=1 Tax=Azospirillum endophyticum TaxID=2800326 RepID=A0ABS1FC22_9PROT|nr:hypothetical protein [Azospirillum endophyticum]MBK1840782.1 hypothetical protein [Azospirillum endophyticum]
MNQPRSATRSIPFPPFPASLLEFGGHDASISMDELSDRIVADAFACETPPCDFDMTVAYVQAMALPPGRYYLYGTGQLTRAILPHLAAKPGVTVAGFLDRNAPAIVHFAGAEVIVPDDLSSRSFDYVLPVHLLDEAEMVGRLRTSGIPADKILRIQSDPGYRRFAVAGLMARHDIDRLGRMDACIVSTLARQWSVVPHSVLARLFDPTRTINLFYGNEGHTATFKDDVFPVIDCRRSLDALLTALRRLQPRVIYLKASTHSHTEALTLILKREFPDTLQINDLNDWSALFSDDFLIHGPLAYSSEAARAARFANYCAGQQADFVICKSGGARWESLAAEFDRPCRTYFPTLPATPYPVATATPRPLRDEVRVLFAGSIGAEEREEDPRPTQGGNFLRYLRTLGSAAGVSLDVFNSGHFDTLTDGRFTYLRDRLVALGVRYHRLTPFSEIAVRAGEWDYGLAASHYAEDRIENVTRVGLGNKFVGYLSAGLPVIIDNRYEFAQALVSEFEAGIVVDPADISQLPEMLRNADRARHRHGAQRLLAHMIECNRRVFDDLSALVGPSLAPVSTYAEAAP